MSRTVSQENMGVGRTVDQKDSPYLEGDNKMANLEVTGNIVVGGTVDGVDLSSFKSDYDSKIDQQLLTTSGVQFDYLTLTDNTIPAIGFTNRPGTGIGEAGNKLYFAIGEEKFPLVIEEDRITIPDGKAEAPSLVFDSDIITGIYRAGSQNIGFSVFGTNIANIKSTGLEVTGNITVSGNVDGVDLSSFKSDYDSKIDQKVLTTSDVKFASVETKEVKTAAESLRLQVTAGDGMSVGAFGNVVIDGWLHINTQPTRIMTKNADQAIAQEVDTKVTFQTSVSNKGGIFYSGGDFTVPVGGIYLISYIVSWSAWGTGIRNSNIRVGSARYGRLNFDAATLDAGQGIFMGACAIVPLDANDSFYLEVWHDDTEPVYVRDDSTRMSVVLLN